MKTISTIILLFLVSYGYAQELRERTDEIHLSMTQPRSKTTVPVISWVTPKVEWTSTQVHQFEIEAIVESDVLIKSIFIKVGDPSTGSARGQKEVKDAENSKTYQIKQKILLADGSNAVEIIVENYNGARVSDIRNITVGSNGPSTISADRKDYALLFATDNYDYISDLVNPIYDATTIANELKERYGFEVEVVENPNLEDIAVKIKDYSHRNYKPQDQLFIFFAGHGQFDEGFGEGYVVAKNSLESDRAKTTYLSHSNLRSYVNNISCDHILLAMDVCFGGTLDPVIAKTRSLDADDELSTSEFLMRKLSKKTRRYITSGGKEYVSDGVVGKHSPFAARFIEALKSRGGDDGILTISEITPFLDKIKQHEPRSGTFGDDEKGSDFVFVIKQ